MSRRQCLAVASLTLVVPWRSGGAAELRSLARQYSQYLSNLGMTRAVTRYIISSSHALCIRNRGEARKTLLEPICWRRCWEVDRIQGLCIDMKMT
jgi:hypothetical protein